MTFYFFLYIYLYTLLFALLRRQITARRPLQDIIDALIMMAKNTWRIRCNFDDCSRKARLRPSLPHSYVTRHVYTFIMRYRRYLLKISLTTYFYFALYFAMACRASRRHDAFALALFPGHHLQGAVDAGQALSMLRYFLRCFTATIEFLDAAASRLKRPMAVRA